MDNKKPSAIDMRLEYNGDKTHVIMEANAEHDYSIRWLIGILYTRSIKMVDGFLILVRYFTHISHQSHASSSFHFVEVNQSQRLLQVV